MFKQQQIELEALTVAVISGGVSIIVGIILSRSPNQSQVQKDNRQDERIHSISDSLKTLHIHISNYMDSTNILTDSTKNKE